MHKITPFLIIAMLPFAFPSIDIYGQNLPAQTSKIAPTNPENAQLGEFLNTLFLSELTQFENPADIAACAGRLLEKSAPTISDPTLRRKTIFSLSKIQKNPEKLAEIRAEHLRELGEYFVEAARVAKDGKRLEDALATVQIALKCDPANVPARLLFASLIEPKAALQTLHYGIKFLKLDSEIAPTYFNRYFDALADLQQDRIAAKQALALLGTELPPEVRNAVANHAAIAEFWIGDYERAIQILNDEELAGTQQGMILKSRCLFELDDVPAAIKILEDGLKAFPPEKRDVILSQLSHYYQRLGKWDDALDVAARRIAENPTAATPYLQRLYLLNKLGETEKAARELEGIFENFASSQTALLSLANLAAETGKPEIAERCTRCAIERSIAPAMFIAAEVEATLTAGEAEKAIRNYAAITQAKPELFDNYEISTKAILAAAYAKSASNEKNPEQIQRLREHSNLLISQYLSLPEHTPDEFLAVISLFRRVGETQPALQIATAALTAFPWHSQLRAEMISLRISLNLVEGNAARTPLEKEIQVLTQMRRPNPAIWQEIAKFLSTTRAVPAQRASALKKLIAPLVKANYHESRSFE